MDLPRRATPPARTSQNGTREEWGMEHTSGRWDNESTNLTGNAEKRLGTKMGEEDDPWDRRGKGGRRKEETNREWICRKSRGKARLEYVVGKKGRNDLMNL